MNANELSSLRRKTQEDVCEGFVEEETTLEDGKEEKLGFTQMH